MIERLQYLSSFFPSIPLESRILAKLDSLHLQIDKSRYLAMAIFLSLIIALATAIIMFAFFPSSMIPLSVPVQLPLPATIAAFLLAFLFFLFLPELELRKRVFEIEAELPLFIRSTGMLMELGLSFFPAIEVGAQDLTQIKGDVRWLSKETRNGLSVRMALSAWASSYDSLTIKRAVTHLLSAYETGSSGADLRKFGEQLLAEQQHKLKEYSSKNAIFGLLFIATSAILPTFFLVYSVLGKAALGSSLGHDAIAIVLLVIFPAVSFLILAVSKLSVPKFALSKNVSINPATLIPGIIFLCGFLIVPQSIVPVFLIAGFVTAAYLAFASYAKEKRQEDIENQLPDALLALSSVPKGTRLESMLGMIATGGYGALSEEAGKSLKQLSNNVKPESVLDDLWQRNSSVMLKRVCTTLQQMLQTNSFDRIRILADDLISSYQILRERNQVMAMQKYTLVFGGILIPLILKMTLNLLTSTGTGALIGEGGGAATVQFASSLIPAYLVLYAAISGNAIAGYEGKNSSAAIYFAVLFLLGLAIFSFITY